MIIIGVTVLILVLIDQITKYFAVVSLMPIENITVLKDVLDLTFVKNEGAAFGIFKGQIWLFVIITIVVSIGIVHTMIKMPKSNPYNLVRVSMVLILAGAIGNFIDRVSRGYVVDFLEIKFISWPVFNIADIYVVTGTIFLIYLIIFVVKDEPKTDKTKPAR